MNNVYVKVSGKYYRIINKISNLNIDISNIKHIDDNLFFKTSYDNYIVLKKYLPHYNVEIIKYYGMNALKLFLKKYCYYIVAFIIGIIFLFLISNVIIDIKVIHSSKYIRNIINNALEDKGIKRLSIKKNYQELEKIKKEILEEHKDDIEWLEIEVHGMKYIVKVEQRIIKKSIKEPSYCQIVAKKDGVITDVLTTKGMALVTRNTYVKKGDILISGDITFNEEVKDQVCASGSVKAEVWYIVNVSLPLSYTKSYKTGREMINFAYDKGLGKTKLLKTKLKAHNDNYYQVISLFGVHYYLVKEQEINKITKHYEIDEIAEKAIDLALEKINIKKDEEDKIITQKVLKKSVNDSTISLDIFFAVNEDIAKQEILSRDGEVS